MVQYNSATTVNMALKVLFVEYWEIGIVAAPTYNSNVSAFDELGIRLKYELFFGEWVYGDSKHINL